MPWSPKQKAAAVALIAALTTLVVFGHIPSSAHWALVLSDAAHGPISGLIAASVFQLLHIHSQRSTGRRWLIAVAATAFLGILIELVQSRIGGDAEVKDVVTDLAGALAGTGLAVYFTHKAPERTEYLRRAGLVCAVVASVFIAAPIAIMAAAYVARSARYPVLMDGNALLGATFITPYWLQPTRERLPADANPIFAGEKGFRVRAVEEPAWSIGLAEVQPDWRPWNALVIELFNPLDKRIPMQLLVFDDPHALTVHAGFVTRRTLEPRARVRWSIPLRDIAHAERSQRIDLSHVEGLLLLSDSGDRNPDLFLLNIRLE